MKGKTNWIALVSGLVGLVTGVTSLSLQMANFTVGPDIVSLPPHQVLVSFHQNPGSDLEMVRLAVVQSHINQNTVGKAAILLRETATMKVGKEFYPYIWQSFEHFRPEGDGLTSTSSSGAHPKVLAPGEVASHETYFAPRSDGSRFESWDDFLSLVEESPLVEIEFSAHFYDGSTSTTRCLIEFTEGRLQRLSKRSWDAPTCQSTEPSA